MDSLYGWDTTHWSASVRDSLFSKRIIWNETVTDSKTNGMFSRRIKLGSWRLQIEDYLMVFAGVCFTTVIVSVIEVAKNGSNYMSLETALSLDEAGVAAAVYGSKMTMVLEIFTLTCLWTIKACLLFLYYRLT